MIRNLINKHNNGKAVVRPPAPLPLPASVAKPVAPAPAPAPAPAVKPAAPAPAPAPAVKPAAPAPAVKPAAPAPAVKPPAPAPASAPAPAVKPAAPAPAPKPVAPTYQKGLVRALLVGINYVGTPYQLAGCINDVVNMQAELQSFFPTCKDYRVITDTTPTKPTKQSILDGIAWLVNGLRPGQNIYFHYSGHGGRVRDTNGDEVSGFDSCIYPVNNKRLETITDDEIRAALAVKLPAGCKCFVVLDSCYSGSAVDLRCAWQAPSANSLTYTENKKYAKTAGQILFLSGSSDTQTAADTVDKKGRPCGALTMALLATWSSYGAAIKTKYLLWDVRKFLRDNRYSQVPQLSTGDYIDLNQVFHLGA